MAKKPSRKAASDEVAFQKEDFINIAVAHREDQLTSRKLELEAGLKKWDRKRRLLFDKLLHLTQAAAEKEALPHLQQAAEAMEKLGASSQIKVDIDTLSLYRDAQTEAEEQLELVETGIQARPSMLESPHGFYFCAYLWAGEGRVGIRKFSEFNEEQLKVYKEILSGDAACNLGEQELKNVRKALKDIPRMERKAKAVFAVQALKGNPKGQEFLKAMMDLTAEKLSLDFRKGE